MMGRTEIFGQDVSIFNYDWLLEQNGVVIGVINWAKTRAEAEERIKAENRRLGKPNLRVGRYVKRGESYESWSTTQSKLVSLIHGRPPKGINEYDVISQYDDPFGIFGVLAKMISS